MSAHTRKSEPIMTSIAPCLSVRRGAEAVDYYKAAFGATELHRVENDAGEIVAQLSIGGRTSGSPTIPTPAPRSSEGGRFG